MSATPRRDLFAYEVRNLRKTYRNPVVVANDGISFSVRPGEAFGLLGANGAGKTTLVRQLVGLLRPSAGEVRLFGERLDPGARLQRRLGRTVSYLPQGTLSLGELRVAEAVRWTGMLRGLGSHMARTQTDDLLARLSLEDVAGRQLRKLSGGQRRLAQIGMTLVGNLPILILDEPTSDIDPALRQRIWSLLAERAREGSAVILVTHDVAEAEHALDRVAILDRGRVVAHGTPGELKARLAHRTRIEVTLADRNDAARAEVGAVIGSSVAVSGRRLSAWVPAEDAIRLLEKLMATGAATSFEDLRLVTPSLADVYLEVSGHALREEEE